MRQNHAEQPGTESTSTMAVVIAQTRGSYVQDDLESPLAAPWLILPEQIGADALWARHTSGPIALMLAVLEDAVRCIQRGRRSRHRGLCALAADAEAWIRCDDRE